MSAVALRCYRADGFAEVCAWCPDKPLADREAEAKGYRITHVICPSCREKQLRSDITADSFGEGFVGLVAVATICEVDPAELWSKFRPKRWRGGMEFLRIDTPDNIVLRRANLGELVGELAVSGKLKAAQRLLEWLTRSSDEQPAATRCAPPSARRGGGWLNAWEEAHES